MPKTSRREEAPGAIRGRVVRGEEQQPGSGLTVRAYDARFDDNEPALGESKTDSRGRFELRCKLPESLDLIVYDKNNDPIGDAGPLSGDARFSAPLIQAAATEAQELNRELALELERFFKQPQNLKRISAIVAEEGGVDAQRIYDELLASDPFGISPFTFRTTICCILYNLLDTFKQTGLGSTLGMGGNTFKHFGFETVRGFLFGPVNAGSKIWEGVEGRPEIDQDWTFKLQLTMSDLNRLVDAVKQTGSIRAREIDEMQRSVQLDPTSEYFQRMHCEIIPCDQVGTMRRFMSDLQSRSDNLAIIGTQYERDVAAAQAAGQPIPPPPAGLLPIQVEVGGTLTFDGTHLGSPAHIEIHPVKHAVIL